MNHKGNAGGFSPHLGLLLMILVVAIGSSAWYVNNHVAQRNGRTSSNSAQAPQYVDQYIRVDFKDGVTFQQADSLVKSLNLSYWNPQSDNEQNFVPHFYRGIKKTQFNQVAANLKKYPEVVSFIDDSSDPINNRANSDEFWTEITFKEETTWPRIEKIFVDSGFGLSNQPESNFTSRTAWLTTPRGQEDFYVNKFKQSPLVKSASRLGKLYLQ